MKLSDAILTGCVEYPKQAFGNWAAEGDQGDICAVCVWGAAVVGKDKKFNEGLLDNLDTVDIIAIYPEADTMPDWVASQVAGRNVGSLFDYLVYLNDYVKVSREALAEMIAVMGDL